MTSTKQKQEQYFDFIESHKCRDCRKWHQCLHEVCDGFEEALPSKGRKCEDCGKPMLLQSVRWCGANAFIWRCACGNIAPVNTSEEIKGASLWTENKRCPKCGSSAVEYMPTTTTSRESYYCRNCGCYFYVQTW
jgi:hypothetical protein